MCTARASRPAVDRAADGNRLATHADALIALAAGPGQTANPTIAARGQTANPTIAAYAAVAEEPPTRPLLDALVARRVRVILPIVVEDGSLDWAPYEGWDALATTRWGLLEPTGRPLGETALERADLVVVPALAVDRAGHRLGRGRGFYDRALTNVDRERRVAVVYASEFVDRVPAEPHDQHVGWALTPDGLTRLSAGSATGSESQ